MRFITLSTLLILSLASARPSLRQRQSGTSFQLQNGIDAISLNKQFTSLNTTSSCISGNACINGQVARCVNGKYVLSPCSFGLTCAVLPLVNSPGTSVTCTKQTDLKTRMVATGVSNGTNPVHSTVTPSPTTSPIATPTAPSGSGSTNSSSAQTSLTLVPSVIANNFSQNGLGTSTSQTGEVTSLTSTNNFINWCATLPNLPITDGQQLKNGSCNPAPMGAIPSTSNMPSVKFVTPVNLAVVPPNTTFQVALAVRQFGTGWFVNPNTNYLAAPQQLDPATGFIQGHAHIVIEALESLTQTAPTDPTKFAFFVGLNGKADASGKLYANVTGGLPEGTYKMSTLVTAMNHQPVLFPVAQHGVADDTIYFTVSGPGRSTNTTTANPTHTPKPSHPATTSPIVHSSTPIAIQTAGAGNITKTC